MYELTFQDCSEVYETYAEAREAQRELNALGMIGSSIERVRSAPDEIA